MPRDGPARSLSKSRHDCAVVGQTGPVMHPRPDVRCSDGLIMDLFPQPGTTGFLILCVGIYFVMVNAVTRLLCRQDRRWREAQKPGIEGPIFMVLALIGGWPAMKYELWFEGNRAGGGATAWVVTLVATAYVGAYAVLVLPGQLPDMTPGEMLSYVIQGGEGDRAARLPRRFGPGADD